MSGLSKGMLMMRRNVRFRILGAVALAALMVGSVITGAGASTHPSRTSRAEVGLSSLPASVQQYYKGYQYFSKLLPNPYASWKAPSPPWKFCYNDSYQGNSWRQDSLAEIEKLVAQYQKAGLAK